MATVISQAPSATAQDVLGRVATRTLRYDFTVWFWGDAIAIDGLLEAADLVGLAPARDACLLFFGRWARQPLGWVDHLTPGGALLSLYVSTGDPELLAAAQRLAAWLTEEVPRSAEGAPLYRPDLPPYRHSVWVDTLYHEPAFFAQLARVTDEPRHYSDALDVWTSHVRALASERGPFLGHMRDTGADLLRGYGWGRGNGWALLGMVDALELLPVDHPGYAPAVQAFRELSEAILAVQDASGFWRTMLHDREAYLESSTAAFFGAAFTKGGRLGLLDDLYASAAERAWRATLSRIDDGGSFFGVSAVTYARTSPEDDVTMYRTLPTEVNVWGQGAALRFAAERLRAELP